MLNSNIIKIEKRFHRFTINTKSWFKKRLNKNVYHTMAAFLKLVNIGSGLEFNSISIKHFSVFDYISNSKFCKKVIFREVCSSNKTISKFSLLILFSGFSNPR